MLQNPRVSVCMITFGHEKFIEKAINGVLMQECNFEIEFIVANDGSPDTTNKIVKNIIETHPRGHWIKYTMHPKNKGMMANFIWALQKCKGYYIALCEGDDYWTDPLKLQKQVDFLEENPDYNICFHRVQIFNQDENKLRKDSITEEVPELTSIENLARGNYIHTPSVLLRNNFTIPKWFSKCPIGDWTLYMIAIKDKKIKKLDEMMAVYRVHDQGIWAKNSEEYRIGLTRETVKLVLRYLRTNYNVKTILGNRLGIKIEKHSFIIRLLKKIKNSLKQ